VSFLTTPTFDPDQYKAGQRKGWSDAASGWRQWWQTIEVGLGPLSERLPQVADVCRGAHNIIQQGIKIQRGCQITGYFDQAQVTIEGLGFDLSHGALALLFPVRWMQHFP